MSQPIYNPQRGAARALLELVAEFPDLPALSWNIGQDGVLRGSLVGPDVTSVVEAWATELHYEPNSPIGYRYNGADRAFQGIYLRWRDVDLSLSFYSDDVDGALLAAVAA